MSRLNIQNDLFLGLQELKRMQRFHKDDGYIRLFKSLINNFGVVKVDNDTGFDNFKVQGGTNTGTIQIAQDSWAINDDIDIIYQEAIDNILITDDSNYYWVKITYAESNLEEGTINLAANGNITGVGTTFTDVLRDQNNYPVKINFPGSALNTGDYQVTSILSDTQAILSGTTGFTNENDLDYKVVGSFTPGINPAGDDRLPYFYDSCTIELILETVLDTAPAKTAGKQFYLARVQRTGSTVTIEDKRTELFSAARTTAGWVQPSVGTGFTNITDQEVMYRINYIGQVEIRGRFTVLTANIADSIFTLPIGFRPAYKKYGTHYEDDSGSTNDKVLVIDTDGTVKPANTNFNWSDSVENVIIDCKFNLD